MSAMQPLRIEANRAYQATRAYSMPPVFPEWDERNTTSDYGLVHLAMNITKQHISHAIIHLLLPSDAALLLQCRKVFVVQVDQAAEAEVHRHLQALEHSQAVLPSPPPASNVRYWHYLQQLTEALAGRPPKGFRFAVTKAANERAPSGLGNEIWQAACSGEVDELLGLCLEWAGHKVINGFTYKNESDMNSLMFAIDKGHEACVRVLIAAKANMAYVESDTGDTVLHCAAMSGRASICRVLLDEGASLTAVNLHGQTPLELAKRKEKAECMAVLEAAGAVLPPAVVAAYAFVDEHIATTKGFRFAVTKAADEQAPPGLDKQIYDAAWQGKLDELLGICQQWAGHQVIDSYKNEGKMNALIKAVINGHEACVRVLTAAKADMAFADSNGNSVLHYAARNSHASICRVLVDEGASLTAVNSDGKTPLELAKARGHAECVAILEAAGAVLPPALAAANAFVDEHIATTKGFRFAVTKAADEQAPPGLDKQIYDAAWEGKLVELLDLCQQWAGHQVIDAYKNEGKMNALGGAALKGHEACVRTLIAANADVAYTPRGSLATALHDAAFSGHASTCRVLIDEGASIAAVDSDGKTPLNVAKAHGHAECVATLEAAGATEGAVKR